MNNHIPSQFGKRVKEIRRLLGLSQKNFAASIDISASFLSEVEAGKSKAGYDFLFNVSKVYHINLHYLLHGTGEPQKISYVAFNGGKKEFGEYSEKVYEMLAHMKKSELLKLAVLEFYIKFMLENEAYIKKEIDQSDREARTR